MKRKTRAHRERYALLQQWCLITGIVAVVLLSSMFLWLGFNLPEQPDVSRLSLESTFQKTLQTTGIQGQMPAADGVAPESPESSSLHHASDVSFTGRSLLAAAQRQTPQDLTCASESSVSVYDTVECIDAPDPAHKALTSRADARTVELLHAVGLTSHLDESTWRTQLSDRFAQGLVPVSNNGFSARETLFLELDAWGDNASLSSVFYEVTQVISADGQVLNGCAGPREPMVGQRIRVPVPGGTPADEAMIRFEVSAPGDLDAIVLDVSAGHEVMGDMETGSVAVAKVSDQAVRLTYREMSMPMVYAFDRLGNVLRRERIFREPDGVHMVFGGYVETCLVVGVRHMIGHTFMACVTLDPGQAVVLSHEPEVPRYTRFDQMPLVQYEPVQSLDVNDLAVHWSQERQQSHFRQILSVDLPANVAVQPDWEVYAHQKECKVRLNGSSGVDNQRVTYRYHGFKEVDQMSGSVWFNVYGKIKRVTLNQQDLEGMCCVAMPRGKTLDVHLDKNKLSYIVLGGDVIQLAAFDVQGRRLKQDPVWRIEQGVKSVYFWGIPDKVVLDISTQTKVARLDFNMTEPLQGSTLYTRSVNANTLNVLEQ